MSTLTDLAQYLYGHRIARFIFSGGMAATTDLGFLYIFVHWFGFHYLPSSVAAFILGIVVSFILQKYFTFSDYTHDRIKQQTTLYLSIHIFNLCLNTLLMYIVVDILSLPYLLSQAFIAALLAYANFLTSKHWVFTPDSSYNK